MRVGLQRLYDGCGYLAGLFMIAILVLILAQIGSGVFGYVFRAGDEFAGYSMAASFFLALAHTFGKGEHIRVSLFLERVERAGGPGRRIMEIWSLGVASLLSGYFAFYSVKMSWTSWVLKDVSQGLIPVPLWFPQLGMAIGTTVFFIAVFEQWLSVIAGGPLPKIESRE